MKAFIAGTLAAAVIAVIAALALDTLGWTSQAEYTTVNVRQ